MATVRSKISQRLEANEAFVSLVSDIGSRMHEGGILIFSGRNTIKLMEVGSQGGQPLRVVVKHFAKPGILKKLGYILGARTKADKAFSNGQELLSRGILTPEPFAAVDYCSGGIPCDSYLLTAEEALPPIEDGIPVHGTEPFDKAMAEAFAAFLAEMHGKGILHHDLNPTNVRYRRREDGTFTFSLIDINRMKFYPLGKPIPMSECIENMTRFTGRMDIFEHVARCYARARGIAEEDFVARAVAGKTAHDKAWRRRKRLLHPFRK